MPDNSNKQITVCVSEAGNRLDHILKRLIPEVGLRIRRRICDENRVLVNGHTAKSSLKVREGDIVSITEPAIENISVREQMATPYLIKKNDQFAFIMKPAGMHTENIAGKQDITLEHLLPEILGYALPPGSLLTRLDFATSGIITVALTNEAKKFYKESQENGTITKEYLALLEGDLQQPLYADLALLLKNSSRVLALPRRHQDIKRHTSIFPLSVIESKKVIEALGISDWQGKIHRFLTLAKCTILKGARHQIRVHASSYGYPILGDRKYNAQFCPQPNEKEIFFLHHCRLSLHGEHIISFPPWLSSLGTEIEKNVKKFFLYNKPE